MHIMPHNMRYTARIRVVARLAQTVILTTITAETAATVTLAVAIAVVITESPF